MSPLPTNPQPTATKPEPNYVKGDSTERSFEHLLSAEQQTRLRQRWQQTLDKMQDACQKSARDYSEVRLVAVSKTKPVAMIDTLLTAGQQDFAENYLQEALPKIEQLHALGHDKPPVWHYVGHIQRNKTRDIATHFAWVHTLERDIIAKRLNDQRPKALPALNVLIQVNIDDERSKSGCRLDEVDALLQTILEQPRLLPRGLMSIPAAQGDCTAAFARLKACFDDIKKRHPQMTQWDTLSMGMSADLDRAIAQGSTMVRVGQAIFGARE